MNWDAIGAIAESIGALGVVISLLYLARQIHQNTVSARAATYQAIVSNAHQINAFVIQDEAVARLRRLGLSDPAQLSPDELMRFGRLLSTYFRFADNLHVQRKNGTLDADQWEGYIGSFRGLLAQPGARAYWRDNQHIYSPSFRELVENELDS